MNECDNKDNYDQQLIFSNFIVFIDLKGKTESIQAIGLNWSVFLRKMKIGEEELFGDIFIIYFCALFLIYVF